LPALSSFSFVLTFGFGATEIRLTGTRACILKGFDFSSLRRRLRCQGEAMDRIYTWFACSFLSLFPSLYFLFSFFLVKQFLTVTCPCPLKPGLDFSSLRRPLRLQGKALDSFHTCFACPFLSLSLLFFSYLFWCDSTLLTFTRACILKQGLDLSSLRRPLRYLSRSTEFFFFSRRAGFVLRLFCVFVSLSRSSILFLLVH